MATSLLSLLEANLGKTPDQIVAALKFQGWIKGSHMPERVWEEWRLRGGLLVIARKPNYEQTWVVVGESYRPSDWNHRQITSDLGIYWFIRSEEFRRGQFPSEEIVRMYQ